MYSEEHKVLNSLETNFHVMVIEETSASFNNTSPIIANDFSEKKERGIQGWLLCQLLLGSWGE